MKHLLILLLRNVQDLQNYGGIYKKPSITLTCEKFLNGKINITKIAILPQLIYKIKAILNKMLVEFLLKLDQNIIKVYLEEEMYKYSWKYFEEEQCLLH